MVNGWKSLMQKDESCSIKPPQRGGEGMKIHKIRKNWIITNIQSNTNNNKHKYLSFVLTIVDRTWQPHVDNSSGWSLPYYTKGGDPWSPTSNVTTSRGEKVWKGSSKGCKWCQGKGKRHGQFHGWGESC